MYFSFPEFNITEDYLMRWSREFWHDIPLDEMKRLSASTFRKRRAQREQAVNEYELADDRDSSQILDEKTGTTDLERGIKEAQGKLRERIASEGSLQKPGGRDQKRSRRGRSRGL